MFEFDRLGLGGVDCQGRVLSDNYICALTTITALTHPFCYREGVVASRSLLPIGQTQGGQHGKDGQR